MSAVWLLVGIVVGYLACFIATKSPRTGTKEDESTVLVKRSKPSLRSPLRTHKTQYDKYRTKESGLYAPMKAKNESKDEVNIQQ